jgi:hypothetical protein
MNTTKKIVINKCFGGFSLSHEAVLRYAEIKGIKLFPEKDHFWHYYLVPKKEYDRAVQESLGETGNYKQVNSSDLYFCQRDIPRDDPALVQVVEEMEELASGDCGKLKIVEIPVGIKWEIDEYDGMESIHEVHNVWG